MGASHWRIISVYFSPYNFRSLQVALSTLLLNLSVLSCGHCSSSSWDDEEAQAQLVTSLAMLMLEAASDQEARFRSLVALGTLLDRSPEAMGGLAKEMEAAAKVRTWKEAVSKELLECFKHFHFLHVPIHCASLSLNFLLLQATGVEGGAKVEECAKFVLGYL